ncbi:hypothetical protein [Geomicrobium sediminis]|uniref:Uncharacterized protein n=1 Tax=Geomicrobium sediminis TaxID=1347788 RepID=A0ABS2PEC5_9BACL|nr:hypothetical protein [Geomicrobium sediminis]MBM7633689.1 hypothetical protein [Geomicrobium sediminis]
MKRIWLLISIVIAIIIALLSINYINVTTFGDKINEFTKKNGSIDTLIIEQENADSVLVEDKEFILYLIERATDMKLKSGEPFSPNERMFSIIIDTGSDQPHFIHLKENQIFMYGDYFDIQGDNYLRKSIEDNVLDK